MYERANDIDRDYAEEAYWRAFCPECGESPCQSDNNHADLDDPGYDVINHTTTAPGRGGVCAYCGHIQDADHNTGNDEPCNQTCPECIAAVLSMSGGAS